MDYTGERFVPTLGGGIRLEHLHRYAWCGPLVKGKRVADVACGEGYGSAELARSAATVVGVDISEDAVAHASAQYSGRPNVRFVHGDATGIPLPDGSVDVVVSFETIEHMHDHDRMLAEVRRILTPEGLLIMSSPNAEVYAELSGAENHFHVKELRFAEFAALIRAHFQQVTFCGQRVSAVSMLTSLDRREDTWQFLTEAATGIVVRPPQVIEPEYHLCLASQAALPEFPVFSLFSMELDNAYSTLQRERCAMQREHCAMKQVLTAVETDYKRLEAEVFAAKDYIVHLEAEVAACQAYRDRFLRFTSWPMWARARRLMERWK